MSTLFGKSVASTYKDLLQVSNNNIGVDNVVRYIEDGEGTRSALALSTDTVVLSGHLLPQVHEQVDLGSAELKFRHLYLSDNTIYIGDQTFNTTDIQAVKDIRSSNVTVTELVSLTENAAQRGEIGLVDLALEFQTEYGSVKDTASSAVQPGTSPTFENVNLTGVITGPEIIKIDPAAINDNTGKVVIAGDLQVDGETTVVNSTTISTSSSVITLAQGATDAAQADGAGVVVDGANATIKYGATDNQWILDREINTPSIVSGKLSHSNKIDLDVSGFTLLSLASDGSNNTATVDAKTTFNDTLNVGEAVQFGPGGSVGGIVPTVNGQSIVWDGAKWRPAVASTGDSEATEVPAAFTQSLPSGNSTYTIAFAQEYTAPPAITTDLQIEGDLPIIPYVITNVTTTNFTIEFAEALPALGYTLHVTFGGRDILWKNGELNSIYYDQGDVVVNNMEISGNLSVAGTTTTINSTDLSIRDRNITLADNTLSRDLSGVNGNAGITWGNDNKVKFLYNSDTGFKLEGAKGLRLDQESGDTGIYLYRSVDSDFQVALGSTSAVLKSAGTINLMPNGTTVNKYSFETDKFNIVGPKVGIGTNSPESLLHIYANASSVNSTRLLTLENYSSDLAQNSSYISFKFTDTNENEDPQVMIGAVVGQNTSADSAVSEGAGAFVVRTNNPSGEGDPADGIQHDDSTNLRERFRVDYRGHVGIGTTQPITTTHIKGDALTIEEPTLTLGRKIQILPPESGVDARIRNNTTAAGFQFQNNPSADGETFVDLVKIDGAGRVGIGTTTIGDNYKLDVRGGVIVDDLRIRDTSFFVEGDRDTYYPVLIKLNDSQFDFTIVRGTHTDATSIGSLNTRIWGHTSAWGTYNSSVNYDHNSAKWTAPASLMSGFFVHPYENVIIMYLLGGRTYALEQKQGSARPSFNNQYNTTDVVDGRIKIFDHNNHQLYIPGPFLHSDLETTITNFKASDPSTDPFYMEDLGRTDVSSKKYRSGSVMFGSEDTADHRFIVNSGGSLATAEFKGTNPDGGARVFLERPTSAGDTWLGWRNTDKVGWLAGMENDDDSFHIYRYANVGDYVEGDEGNSAGHALTIAPSGHVGINTTTPECPFTIKGFTTLDFDAIKTELGGSAGNSYYTTYRAAGGFKVVRAPGTAGSLNIGIDTPTEGTGFNGTGGHINFHTNSGGTYDTRLTIHRDGNVGVGDGPFPNVKFGVQSSLQALYGYRSTNDADHDLFTLHSDVGGTKVTKFKIEADGDVWSSSNSYTSDVRFKTEIGELTHGIDTLKLLQPKQYKMIGSEAKGFKYGFVAQDLEAILPDLVRDIKIDDSDIKIDGSDIKIDDSAILEEDLQDAPPAKEYVESSSEYSEDGTFKALEYNSIIAILTKATQEQQVMIDELKAQNEQLISRIETLENK